MTEDDSVGDGCQRTDTAARITHREAEEKITFFYRNRFEAVKAYSEETVRTRSLGVVPLCRRNLGSFK